MKRMSVIVCAAILAIPSSAMLFAGDGPGDHNRPQPTQFQQNMANAAKAAAILAQEKAAKESKMAEPAEPLGLPVGENTVLSGTVNISPPTVIVIVVHKLDNDKPEKGDVRPEKPTKSEKPEHEPHESSHSPQ